MFSVVERTCLLIRGPVYLIFVLRSCHDILYFVASPCKSWFRYDFLVPATHSRHGRKVEICSTFYPLRCLDKFRAVTTTFILGGLEVTVGGGLIMVEAEELKNLF